MRQNRIEYLHQTQRRLVLRERYPGGRHWYSEGRSSSNYIRRQQEPEKQDAHENEYGPKIKVKEVAIERFLCTKRHGRDFRVN